MIKWPVGENSIPFPPRGKPECYRISQVLYKVNGGNGPLMALDFIEAHVMREVIRKHAGYQDRPRYVSFYDGRLYIAPAPDADSKGKVSVRYLPALVEV